MINFALSEKAAEVIKSYKTELIDVIDSNLSDEQFISAIQTVDNQYLEQISQGIRFTKPLAGDLDEVDQRLIVARYIQATIKQGSERIQQLC